MHMPRLFGDRTRQSVIPSAYDYGVKLGENWRVEESCFPPPELCSEGFDGGNLCTEQ